MTITTHIAAGMLIVGAACSGAAASIIVDSFTEALPNQTIPTSRTQYPILWTGTIGGVTQDTNQDQQTGLAGTIGGQREVRVAAGEGRGLSYAYVTKGRALIGLNQGLGSSVSFGYGFDSDLSLDLVSSGDGAWAFDLARVYSRGGLSDPVRLVVSMVSGVGTPEFAEASQTLMIGELGEQRVAYNSFAGLDLTDVDRIVFQFSPTSASPIQFGIGSISSQPMVPTGGSAMLAGVAGMMILRRRR